jgi:hypothetical protein
LFLIPSTPRADEFCKGLGYWLYLTDVVS